MFCAFNWLFCTVVFGYCVISVLKGSDYLKQKPTKKCCWDKIQ